jgi:8-oxo-dGTP pyrophosphatase MutT (NUDIX family)
MNNNFFINISLIVRHCDTFLMIKRAQTEEVFPGCWGIPGGKVELFDESLEAAALRESYEECGIKIQTQLKIVSHNIVRKEDFAVLYIVMMTEIPSKVVCFPGVEIEKVQWMTKSEIRALEKITPKTAKIIMKYG